MLEQLQHSPEAQEFAEALRLASAQAWENAMLAAKVHAIGGTRLGGIHLRCRASAVRTEWMGFLRSLASDERGWIRITPQTSPERLGGGLDLAASARLGRKISQTGILAQADGGTLVIALAEKLEGPITAVITRAIDSGVSENLGTACSTAPSRFSVIAIDEGMDESETIPSGLKDRLGLTLDLNPVAYHHADLPDPHGLRSTLPAWAQCAGCPIPDEIMALFADLSGNLGNRSIRKLFHLADTARILATLDGEVMVGANHAMQAIRLCMGISLHAPAQEPEAEPQQEQSQDRQAGSDEPPPDHPRDEEQRLELDIEQLLDMAIETKRAALSAGIGLGTMGATKDARAASGKSGKTRTGARRGRPVGHASAPPFPDAKPDIAATIRTAAPWQKIRRNGAAQTGGARHIVRPSDFRYKRFKHATRSTAIFVVDASGSTALERLGETKGAIELLFADCYVRRDEVGLIAFRGTAAETILEPTRSLVRAKRMLSDMAGGGPTPLAKGIQRGLQTALNARRQGFTPILVLLTDGSANIDLEGKANRQTAARDSELASRQVNAAGVRSVCIDVSRRPGERVRQLASTMGADYCPLPSANAASMSRVVSAYMEAGQS